VSWKTVLIVDLGRSRFGKLVVGEKLAGGVNDEWGFSFLSTGQVGSRYGVDEEVECDDL
jgi:hypothetical protein